MIFGDLNPATTTSVDRSPRSTLEEPAKFRTRRFTNTACTLHRQFSISDKFEEDEYLRNVYLAGDEKSKA